VCVCVCVRERERERERDRQTDRQTEFRSGDHGTNSVEPNENTHFSKTQPQRYNVCIMQMYLIVHYKGGQ